ncbi:MAG: T9SS C-terminal target domain-containing protein [Ignavibacteriae bacterium]|nr:MAG: T9SS C-terminal target domain-containing protein [Ignavibacteriota bacterium]
MNKKNLLYSAVLIFSFLLYFSISTMSQTPQFYNYQSGGTANSFPFNIAAGKMVQWLVGPGEFNTPGPATSGNITKFYFRVATGYPINNFSYTNFKIIFAQTTLTALPTGSLFSSTTMDTVFQRASVTLNYPADTWALFTLDHPFAYNNAQSLVIQIEQCAVTGASGYSVLNTTVSSIRRTYSAGGCPFVYGGQVTNVLNCGIDVGSATDPNLPNYLYYKFENNPSGTNVLNCALPGVGTTVAPIAGLTLTPGGQFDTCITGTGAASGGVTTGYNWNMGTSSWTISMWMEIPTSTSGSAYYLFGDAGSGSFRCFHNGVAGSNNLVVRGTGITDITVTGIGPAPTVVTIVYDSAAGNVKAYKNGVLAVTVPQTLNITTGTGFKVGGYSTSTSFIGKMDEIRLYKKALTAGEVTAMWNANTFGCGDPVGKINGNSKVPDVYKLDQNYPNPFNPTTTISFAIPKAGNVELVVFDVLGRNVATLVNGYTTVGNHSIEFDASSLASGIYFYTITAGDFTATKKMMLIK